MFLHKAYIAIHKFDIICKSETYLDSNTPDNNNLEISGHNLVRSDHPPNNKRGSVCIYYKGYLQESICFEPVPGLIGHKTCNFLSFYRSPNQTQDDVETFTENLGLNFKNLVQRSPFLVVKIGDFNTKSGN